MLREVPTGISDFQGTIAVSTISPFLCNELYVAVLTAGFDKADGFKSALHLASGPRTRRL